MKPSRTTLFQSARDRGRVPRPPACPPRHREEERRRVEHPQREQRERVERVPCVGELHQDRLDRKAEHADDRQQRPDPARRQSASLRTSQSHCTRPAIGGNEDDGAERDPVPRERHEIVVAHVADQPAHAEERGDERRREADAEGRQVGGREQVPVLQHLVAGGREQRRNGEKERELGGRRARQPEQHAADDRRAGARGARDEGQRLRQPDLQRVRPAHVVDAVDPHGVRPRLLPPFRPQDDEARPPRTRRPRAPARTGAP